MQARIPDVVILDELGRGLGGVAFRGTFRGAGCTIKRPLRQSGALHAGDQSFEQDVLQLARLRHSGLPRVLHLDGTGDASYAILETQPGLTLVELFAGMLSEIEAVEIALRLAGCVLCLHEAGFVHADLSCANVLWSRTTRRICLLDTGTVHRPIPFDTAADFRALGAALHQLAAHTNVVPHDGSDDGDITRIAHRWSSSPHMPLPQLQRSLARRHALLIRDRPTAQLRTSQPGVMPIKHVRSELSLLRRCWDATSDHDGKVLVVLGPAGSGKSRLLEGFAESLSSQGVPVLGIKCADNDWAPFSAIKRLLDQHLDDIAKRPADERGQAEQALRDAAGPIASHLRLLSPQLAAVFQHAQTVLRDGDAQEVFIAGLAEFLGKYLESSARSALFIDDVHWLDASSRMVISRLAARLCPQGHMLVCGARNDEELHETIDRLESVLPVGLLEKLELGSLTEPDAHEVVAEFLGEAKVPSELVEPLSRLSDGTPLTLLELLDLAFEQRLLRPRHGTWQLDVAPLHQMRLPGSSRALIERRLALLDVNAVASLRAAAVVRSRISPTVLAAVTGTSDEEVRATLDRAAAARVLLRSSEGLYSFVHDCIWEALLRVVPAHEQRALHQRVADALWSERGTSSSHDYDIAKHLAAGIVEHNPLRTYEALRLAGKRAIAACDDALALSFLKPAQRAAQLAQLDLTRDFYVDLAETSLRAGATTESLGYFKLALTHSRPGTESAHVRGRIAWIHHNESRAQACWTELAAALREYNRRLPGETGLSLLRAGFSRAAARSPLGIVRAEQNDLETLCDLYVCCTRFAIESGNPTRALASILYLAAAATQLRPCRAVVYAEVYTAFGLSALSPRTPWREHLARGQRIAQEIADPIALTLYHQGYHVVLAWVGDIEEAERQAWICVVERGNYMELGELCHLCFGMYAMQNALGRPAVGLAWLERAIARVVQSARAPALFELIEEAACATLVALGRERELPELRRRVAGVQRTELQPGSYFHFLSYQHRVQTLIDNDELDAPFEALVREWQALGQKPKSTHIAVAIFFVHVAHARVHQCLRTPAAKRGPLLEKLRLALDDVEAVSGYTLIAGHACVTRAAYDWFRGATSDAEQLLAKAERLARETSNAWVSFAAARLRAHMLKARGKLTAARDEARTAAQLARVYGARSRLRVICEEFDLGEFMVDDRPGDPGDSPTVRRHLDALLHIAQASSRDLGPRRQARYIVEELLETLAAERGFLYMRDANTGMLHCHAACHASGEELVTDESACDGALVEQVYATGQTLLANTGRPRASAGSLHEHTCIVVALVLREQVVGVLYLDRHAAAGSFSSEDVALLEALANQVPVVLELAGALRERERLELNLRQAQKMEAIGRLAGGIAHDFNNILATIEFAAGCLTSRINPQGEEDLSEIRDASRRGAELTRQLLMLSRGKSVPPRRIDLVEVLQRQAPMLGRMVRSDVQIEMDLTDQALPAMADPSQIERLVMNLCRNASDAMPSGGGITIRLRLATQAPETLAGSSQQHSPGYAELSVIDTGTGMSDEVRSRLFEPFFTTKSTQQGTGLGLAIVYTIVQQYGGLIDVLSEVGAGTTFRIHLPLAHDTLRPAFAPISTRPQRDSTPPERRTGRKTIIVVDDDDILRKQSARTLEAAGFLVWVARDGQDALRVIAEADHEPELAVTDVQMPGMDGVQLAERLRTNHPDIKLVFVSGDGPDALISSGSLDDNAVFLQKPFKPDALLREVEMLLQSTSHTTAVSGIHKLLGAPPEIDEADLTR